MATKKTAEIAEIEENEEGLVRIIAPYARSDEQPLIIGVNGVNTAIPQDGKEHWVKPEVAYEFERSRRAEIVFNQTQERLVQESRFTP